jgi:integrase
MGREALTVKAANQRLDAAQMGLRLYQRGERLSLQQAKMPFPPYSLRHAWSLRSALWLELPTAVASQFMGHNPNVQILFTACRG